MIVSCAVPSLKFHHQKQISKLFADQVHFSESRHDNKVAEGRCPTSAAYRKS